MIEACVCFFNHHICILKKKDRNKKIVSLVKKCGTNCKNNSSKKAYQLNTPCSAKQTGPGNTKYNK